MARSAGRSFKSPKRTRSTTHLLSAHQKVRFINVGQMDFRAHHTKVASLDIVNVQLIDPKTKKPSKWALLSYTHPDADTIRIRLINERVVPLPPSTQQGNPGGDRLTTPDAMRKHVESVAERPDLFSAKEMVFTRTEQ
jgi:hypothetical protein